MARKKSQPSIHVEIYLKGHPRCSHPECQRTIDDPGTAIFIMHAALPIAFCRLACFDRWCQETIERKRASAVATKKNDLLTKLGYGG